MHDATGGMMHGEALFLTGLWFKQAPRGAAQRVDKHVHHLLEPSSHVM